MNPASYAQGIHWLLSHPEEAEAMGRRGAEAVETRFNWSREATALLGLYRRTLVKQ